MNKIDRYIEEVLNRIVAEGRMKERIRNDLYQHLSDLSSEEDIDDALARMGDPEDVARDFMDTIYEDKSEIIDKLVNERAKVNRLTKGCFEYRSKAEIFGLPLVHIKINKYGKPCIAKGIIAIGTVSLGVISIGAIPVGIISIGGAAVGLISFGGLAIGLLLAVGGFAAGALAFGGFALGLGTIGGFAFGEIAIGGYARGTVAVGAKAVGQYCLNTNHVGPETREAVTSMIKTAFPHLPDWIVRFFTSVNISTHYE